MIRSLALCCGLCRVWRSVAVVRAEGLMRTAVGALLGGVVVGGVGGGVGGVGVVVAAAACYGSMGSAWQERGSGHLVQGLPVLLVLFLCRLQGCAECGSRAGRQERNVQA